VSLPEAALRRIASDLQRHHRRWALVGGFAVSARAEPRFTRDIDAAVMVENDAYADGLVRTLIADGYELLHAHDCLPFRLACRFHHDDQ
jgi:hypothetical protein